MFASVRSIGSYFRTLTSNRSDTEREAERLLEACDYPAAELCFAQAILEAERKHMAADHRALLRLALAEAQRKQFRAGVAVSRPKLAEAEETVRSALELAERGGSAGVRVQCLDALAGVLADKGDCEGVERLTQEAAALEVRLKNADRMQAARRLHRLGLMRERHGRPNAIEALKQAASIYEQVLGPDHLATANCLSDLGAAHYHTENYSEAQQCLRRAIRIHERQCGLDAPESVADLKLLTESLEAAGDLDGAAAQFERVLAAKLRTVGAGLDSIADLQVDLARRYMGWRRFSRARELLMEAIGTYKRTGGARLASACEDLGRLEEELGHYHDALRELARAGKVWESVRRDHPKELMANLEHRAKLYELLRQHKEAEFLREQAGALRQAADWAAAG
jgi:tetratricopeptide (TPR) repeat protein